MRRWVGLSWFDDGSEVEEWENYGGIREKCFPLSPPLLSFLRFSLRDPPAAAIWVTPLTTPIHVFFFFFVCKEETTWCGWSRLGGGDGGVFPSQGIRWMSECARDRARVLFNEL